MSTIICSAPLFRQTAVIPTSVIHLLAWQAQDFAEYLESEQLAERLREQHVLDCALLKKTSEGGFYLDRLLIGQIAPEVCQWMSRCSPFSGCRVVQYEKRVIDDLLADYLGGQWNEYAVVAASALEISIVLELRACPCHLELL